jgi:hypothetical protein
MADQDSLQPESRTDDVPVVVPFSDTLDGQGGSPGFWLSLLGWVLTAAGVIAAIIGLTMKTTVTSYSGLVEQTNPALAGETSEIFNTGLIQNQNLTMTCAAALFLAGVIMLSAGAIISVIWKHRQP